MECDRCHGKIDAGEENEHLGQILCEDCYMDVLSPVRTCDPWAVHSAKTFEKKSGGVANLTSLQEEIIRVLKETGGVEPKDLSCRLSKEIKLADLEREFAALRHMEKVRGEKRGDKVYWVLWS